MKFYLLIGFLLSTSIASAKTVARVADFGGTSFLFLENGQSKEIQYGDKVPDLSQVMVDDQAYVTLVDDNGNIHYLAGGTFVKIYNNLLEVQNGYVWTKAHGDKPGLINTVNSVAKYSKGEFITTVSSIDKKSQLLVLFGQVQFASSTEPELTIPVSSGEFTFIDQEYENGLPRSPTRVGISSYQQVKGVFANISSLKSDKFEREFLNLSSKKAVRKIASVDNIPAPQSHKVSHNHSKGRVTYVKTYEEQKREPQSVKKPMGAYDYYKKVKKAPRKSGKKANVNYFGFSFKQNQKVSKTKVKKSVITVPVKSYMKSDRQPASVKPNRAPNGAPKQTIINDINNVFEKSYKSNLRQNLKHSDEVNDLIDELKTFRNNYEKSY